MNNTASDGGRAEGQGTTAPASGSENIFFVACRAGKKWSDLERLERDGVSVDEMQERMITGVDTWILQSFLILKDRLRARGHTVRFSKRFEPGAICIAHRDDLRMGFWPHRSYLVVVRADRPPVYAADQVVVQNATLARASGTHFLPFWPQPGLVPRNPDRGTEMARLGYLGRSNRLPQAFQSPDFRRQLADLGVELVVRDRDWHDYTEIDAVLAVRTEPEHVVATKPASKLVNAWLAGVPALLGAEPAYRELRESELDFVEVRTAEDASAAVARLRSDGGLYRDMVENGRRRAERFRRERVAADWVSLLEKSVLPGYRRWVNGWGARDPARFLWFALRMGRQRLAAGRFRSKR